VTAAEGGAAHPGCRGLDVVSRALTRFEEGAADDQAGASSGDATTLRQPATVVTEGSRPGARGDGGECPRRLILRGSPIQTTAKP
jgi:hypothetical protein